MAKLTPAEEGIQAARTEAKARRIGLYPNTGTPKTLEESIANGLAHASNPIRLSGIGQVAAVEVHVRDYLAQVLGAALMSANTPDEEALVEAIATRCGIRRGDK